jgi:hypothetical protein
MITRFLIMFFLYFFLIIAMTFLGMYLNEKNIIGTGLYFLMIILSVIVPLLFFNRIVFKTSGRDLLLLQEGTPAVAEILEVRDTGVTVNDIFINVKLRLRVTPDNIPPFEVITSKLYSRLEFPSAGDRLKVKYIPGKLTKVLIV